MNVFPKCMINRAPQITYNGYVLPCCWIPYTEDLPFRNESGQRERRKNPFLREDFNLYNNKLKDILGSHEWQQMLNNIFENTPIKCTEKCGKFLVNNGIVETQNITVPKFDPNNTNKKEHMSSISSDPNVFWKSVKEIGNQNNKLQLETTSRCTLACPYCSRTKEAGTGKYRKGDLSLDVIEDILFYTNWKKVDDCGRYGDPIFYKYFHEMLDMLKSSTVRRYQMHNAATGRGLKWWEKTIEKMVAASNSGTYIQNTFGIDGLEDTGHIHRVNQDWNEITTAMRMSREAGIDTVWQFIPLRHNEHQIEQVKELAAEWDVRLSFTISNRFNGLDDPMIPLDPNLHAYKQF